MNRNCRNKRSFFSFLRGKSVFLYLYRTLSCISKKVLEIYKCILSFMIAMFISETYTNRLKQKSFVLIKSINSMFLA